MKQIDITSILNSLGIYSESLISFIKVVITLAIASLLGWLAYIIAKKWLARFVMKIVGRTAYNWDNLLFDQKFFNRLGTLFAPIIIRISLASIEWEYIHIINKLLSVWITFAFVLVISSILDGINRIYESYPIAKDRPIKVFMQVLMIFLWCAAIIVIISIFTAGRNTTRCSCL